MSIHVNFCILQAQILQAPGGHPGGTRGAQTSAGGHVPPPPIVTPLDRKNDTDHPRTVNESGWLGVRLSDLIVGPAGWLVNQPTDYDRPWAV